MTTPRPPAPLPRSARALLAAYRDAHEIPGAAKDRIWSVVGAEDAPAPAFDPQEDDEARDAATPRPRGTRDGTARWLGWSVAMLAAAAVLVLAWQLGGKLAERRQAARTPDAASMHGGAGSTRGHASPSAGGRATPRGAASASEGPSSISTPDAPSTAPSSALAPSPSGSQDADAASSRPRLDEATGATGATERAEPAADPASTLSSERPTDPASTLAAEPPTDPASTRGAERPTDPASTLAAERELVARAWGALALGETDPALEAVAEHARRFPAGLLAPERAAIDTIARCRRGDADGLRRAAAFHRAHPRSPLSARIDEACSAPSQESTAP